MYWSIIFWVGHFGSFLSCPSVRAQKISCKLGQSQYLAWNMERISQDFIILPERDTLLIDCSAFGANSISLRKDEFNQIIGN